MALLPEARVATQRVADFIVRQSLRRAA